MSKVRVTIFSNSFSPNVGGVETAALILSEGLSKLGESDTASKSFDVTVVTNTPGTEHSANHAFRIIRRPSFVQLMLALNRADVVHLAGPSLLPLALARFLRKPTVIEHHGYQAICPNGILIQQPDRSICPGHFQARRYLKCLKCQKAEMSTFKALAKMLAMIPRYLLSKGVRANVCITEHVLQRHHLPSSQCIYYGIEDHGASKSVQLTNKSTVTRKPFFAFVGRFVPEKGIPVLLKATQGLASEGLAFELLMIGDGPQRNELERLIVQYGLSNHVRLTGFVANSAIRETLDGVGAVIMPSVWEETAGLAAIEQMMEGRVVIASNLGGLGEIVRDGGLLFPVGDSTALAQHMKTVLTNPALVAEIGSAARRRALELFQSDRMVREHARLYARLLEERAT